jgi:hypothetical protein
MVHILFFPFRGFKILKTVKKCTILLDVAGCRLVENSCCLMQSSAFQVTCLAYSSSLNMESVNSSLLFSKFLQDYKLLLSHKITLV